MDNTIHYYPGPPPGSGKIDDIDDLELLKDGDRVRVINNVNKVPIGKVGKVIVIAPNRRPVKRDFLIVEFEDWHEGYDLSDLWKFDWYPNEYKTPSDSRWSLRRNDIEKVRHRKNQSSKKNTSFEKSIVAQENDKLKKNIKLILERLSLQTENIDPTITAHNIGVQIYHELTGKSELNNPAYLLDGYPKPNDILDEIWERLEQLINSNVKDKEEIKAILESMTTLIAKIATTQEIKKEIVKEIVKKEQPTQKRKFQVGDKVRIIGNSLLSDFVADCLKWFAKNEGFIISIRGNPYKNRVDFADSISVGLNDNSARTYLFAAQDLELIEPVEEINKNTIKSSLRDLV